jgi:hypothetical protein
MQVKLPRAPADASDSWPRTSLNSLMVVMRMRDRLIRGASASFAGGNPAEAHLVRSGVSGELCGNAHAHVVGLIRGKAIGSAGAAATGAAGTLHGIKCRTWCQATVSQSNARLRSLLHGAVLAR